MGNTGTSGATAPFHCWTLGRGWAKLADGLQREGRWSFVLLRSKTRSPPPSCWGSRSSRCIHPASSTAQVCYAAECSDTETRRPSRLTACSRPSLPAQGGARGAERGHPRGGRAACACAEAQRPISEGAGRGAMRTAGAWQVAGSGGSARRSRRESRWALGSARAAGVERWGGWGAWRAAWPGGTGERAGGSSARPEWRPCCCRPAANGTVDPAGRACDVWLSCIGL